MGTHTYNFVDVGGQIPYRQSKSNVPRNCMGRLALTLPAYIFLTFTSTGELAKRNNMFDIFLFNYVTMLGKHFGFGVSVGHILAKKLLNGEKNRVF